MSFRPVTPADEFTKLDHQTLKFWKENNIFHKSEQINAINNPKVKDFVFYDGPPGTNGRPHIGHIMQSALKDLWPRFKTMQGYRVLRKGGWDTHGLPVELTSEKELGLSGKLDVEKYGIKNFVEYCRNTVLRYRSDWVSAITRVGRFLDMENDYLTMSNDFIQSDWWGLKVAFKKNLLYRDFKIVPYCCRCGTALSNHEVAQGYKDVSDLTLTAKFALKNEANTFILAWTTTPWTLLGNVALCVNEKIEYSKLKIKTENGFEFVILATETIEANKKALGEYESVSTFKGKDLVGKEYQGLWENKLDTPGKIHCVVSDDYVTTTDGTGVVHLALYGDDDFRLIKKNGLKQIQHVGADGKFKSYCGAFAGRMFKEPELDVEILKDLAARKLMFSKFKHEHSYPHCWRCDTALMYFAKSCWFIKTTAFKDQMLSENDKINWQPPHIGKGRFGNWLENNVDWAVTRDRFWGSPLNIWSCDTDQDGAPNYNNMICVDSIKELQSLGAYFESSGKPIPSDLDLHIPTIDDVVFKNAQGQVFRRQTGVLDCWYNAGIMPWGQFGYPAKDGSKEIFETQFPADFICEAIDQTRGWFYTLLAVSCMIDGRSSFKNVICTELILDMKGKKMSKSLGNVIDPIPLIEKFGADAVRWTFYDSDPWQVKRYGEDLPKEALRAIFIPIWNCYSFFVTYANLDGWTPAKAVKNSTIELDRWILSALKTATIGVTESLEKYDVRSASVHIYDFIDSLSNWYIRRSRKRFWKSENDQDKNCAYSTLYTVLVDLAKLIAPMAPFISEEIYQNLVRSFDKNSPESVHLCRWTDPTKYESAQDLEQEIKLIQEAATLARSLRTEHNLKVRQPLSKLILVANNKQLGQSVSRHLDSLAEEVNVKKIEIADSSAGFVEYAIKPNWKELGPRFGKDMKALNTAIAAISSLDQEKVASGQSIHINLNQQSVEIAARELVVELKAKAGLVAISGKLCTVALNTEVTKDLLIEGHAREILSVIQKHRKELDFDISDQVKARIWAGSELKQALEVHRDYIAKECLAKEFSLLGENPGTDPKAREFDVNGNAFWIELSKV